MSKNKFKSFLQFIGLGELVFNNNEATFTLEQATEASDKLDTVTQENERLKAANALLSEDKKSISEDNKIFISKIAAQDQEIQKLIAENATLKNSAGASPAKAITNKDAIATEENPCVTSKDNDFMDNMRAFETNYSFLKR